MIGLGSQLHSVLMRQRASIAAGSIVLAGALGLKGYYAHAAVTDLLFVLAPSCRLAGLLGSLHFVWDPARGFVAHDVRMVVGTPCAGVNFLAACWLAVFFCGQGAMPDLRRKLAWMLASVGLAYLATLLANGARIALAAHLGLHAFAWSGLTHERVHRLIGVFVYSIALFVVCRVVTRMLDAARARGGARPYAVPLGCYALVALVLPLGRRAFGTGAPGFAEHAAHTLLAACTVAGLVWLSERLFDRLFSRAARS